MSQISDLMDELEKLLKSETEPDPWGIIFLCLSHYCYHHNQSRNGLRACSIYDKLKHHDYRN